jgi:hypothetical protein
MTLVSLPPQKFVPPVLVLPYFSAAIRGKRQDGNFSKIRQPIPEFKHGERRTDTVSPHTRSFGAQIKERTRKKRKRASHNRMKQIFTSSRYNSQQPTT